MKKIIAQDTSFYESLSDIAMATLGIFVIFFVINLIFINSDVIEQAVRNDHLNKDITISRQELEDFKAEEKRQIADFKIQNEQQIMEIESEIQEIQEISVLYEEKISDAKVRIQEELNVDEVVSVEVIRQILEQVKLKRKKVEGELQQIRMRANHVRQEFNEYVEVENSYPYLELGIRSSSNSITLNDVWISMDQFRAILQEINAGSGFTFRMKRELKEGKYIRPKAPSWLNDILVSEGWFPIVNVDG
tara:strand:+ start:2831 stop:3574 length:744 start_codon:yes stop_codon:yes gene_type:complete